MARVEFYNSQVEMERLSIILVNLPNIIVGQFNAIEEIVRLSLDHMISTSYMIF